MTANVFKRHATYSQTRLQNASNCQGMPMICSHPLEVVYNPGRFSQLSHVVHDVVVPHGARHVLLGIGVVKAAETHRHLEKCIRPYL
jgi:hypothetical protein